MLRRRAATLLIIMASALLLPATATPQTPGRRPEPDPIDVTIRARVLREIDGAVIVRGNTNLPDRMPLTVSLSPVGDRALGEFRVQVLGGKFQAGPFIRVMLNRPMRHPPGSYMIEITSPSPSELPGAVRQVVGARGEALRGPAVRDGRVHYVTLVTVH